MSKSKAKKGASQKAINKTTLHVLIASSFLALIVIVAVGALMPRPSNGYEITVYKTPQCECCKRWASHLRDNGFKVVTHNLSSLDPIKAEHGIGDDLQACHTSTIEGYVVEGHVPADVIERLLLERPAFKGIVVPGMPVGSPGMEGRPEERYNVLTFDDEGNTEVYVQR